LKYIIILLISTILFAVSYQDGYNNFVRGEYQNAADVFTVMLNDNPKDAKAMLWLGKSYFNLGDQKNAINYLIKSVKVNNNQEGKDLLTQIEYIKSHKRLAESYYHKGYFAFTKAEYELARKYYWQAILLDKKVSKYHLWHLRCLIALGENNKAKAQLLYAEKLKPYMADLNILKNEDLRGIRADKEYYQMLKDIGTKNAKKKQIIVKKVTPKKKIKAIQPKPVAIKKTPTPVKQNSVSIEKTAVIKKEIKNPIIPVIVERKEEENIEPQKIAETEEKWIFKYSNKKEIIEEPTEYKEYISQIPTLNLDDMRKEAAGFRGSATRIRYTF